MKRCISFYFLLLILSIISCKENENKEVEFTSPVRINVLGYSDHVMEPFISRDGNLLFFNNLNEPTENTNLHWAEKIDETTFQYLGELSGVNSNSLEGVPTMDNSGNFYFVSDRDYTNSLSTLFTGQFNNGIINDIELLGGISKQQPGWVNFDIEVSEDGQFIYFVDAEFNQTGSPTTADLVIAERKISGFERLSNSSEILKNINTSDLEYAACISVNQLELYFTRVSIAPGASSNPEIYYTSRENINQAFKIPIKLNSLSGFVEGPTLAPDQKTVYFHKKENNIFVLYAVIKL